MSQASPRTRSRTRLAFFGGPLDTGNLGVSALGLATLAAVARRTVAEVTLFDNGAGPRHAHLDFDGDEVHVIHRGAWMSRRVHRTESLWQMLVASTLGASRWNDNLRALSDATEVWDVSGGDSFSDIYGDKRFMQIALAKQVALQRSSLVLLPQTYGPFHAPRNRRWARHIVLHAREAWARDAASHQRLRDLLGGDFDPDRHRQGVDVAFTLPASRPPATALGPLASWLEDDDPVVGINISGLLGGADAPVRFGLQADHDVAMQRLIERLLNAGVRVVLVPHVQGKALESDSRACTRLASIFDDERHLAVLPDGLDAMGTKWVISRMHWMTGARMHATIAALSTSTPVTGIAYSDKMRGVFASCGIGDEVADARLLDTHDLVDALWQGFRARAATREILREHVPATVAVAESTFDHLVGRLRGETT